MIYSYCKKCKLESPGDICPQCGKRASAGAQRNIWSIAAVPVSDGRAWRGILCTLAAVAALLMILIFGLEAMLSGIVFCHWENLLFGVGCGDGRTIKNARCGRPSG